MKDNIMELKILEHSDFGQVRTLPDENGKMLFCGSDVAKILGYAKPRNAINRHCKYAAPKQGVIDKMGREQNMLFITEGDLYRLIVNSKLPSAEAFEKWVFDEVLPSLRKYGMYATDEVLADDEKLLETANLLKNEKLRTELLENEKIALGYIIDKQNTIIENSDAIIELKDGIIENNEIIIEQKETIIELQQPFVDYVEYILNGNLDMTPTQIAADYDISATKLNKILHLAGLQRKVNGQWILYKKFMDEGYTNTVTGRNPRNNRTYVQTLWTQKGRLLIHEILVNAGHYPNSKGVF